MEQLAPLGGPDYRYVVADMLDTPALVKILRSASPEVVIHLAAALRDEAPRDLVSSNIGSIVSLIDAIVGSGKSAPRLLVGSSGSVYGPVEEAALPIAEDQPCAPGDPYSISKRAAEDLSRVLALEADVETIWARIFNPMGPGQDERHLCGAFGHQLAEMAEKVRPPEITLGPLHTTRDYQHIDDTAAALVLLAERGRGGTIYNVASGEETAGTEILETLCSIAGVERLEKHRRPLRRVDMVRHFADITRITELGYVPSHTIEEGLAQIVDYYRGPVASACAAGTCPDPTPPAATTVSVRTSHSYQVETSPGLLQRLPLTLAQRYPDQRLCIFTDDVVHGIHGQSLVEQLKGAGVDVGVVVVPAGETSKSQASADAAISSLRDIGFDRRSVLVNVGGGMITDLGGYVAATYLRGVPYLNVPTTLLAQHDSAVGGKVAVNAPWAKNFVGAFHHPIAVINDPVALLTLDSRELAAGVAESIKVAICGAPGLFDWLCAHPPELLFNDPEALGQLVRRSAAHKADLLEPDPHEVDLRRVLNLGHTFGHPLETQLNHRGIRHGEAVAFGIAVAAGVGVQLDLLDPLEAERILNLLHQFDLPPVVDRSDLLVAEKGFSDVRLVRAGVLNFVVPTSTRTTTILPDIEPGTIRTALDWIQQHPVTADRIAD